MRRVAWLVLGVVLLLAGRVWAQGGEGGATGAGEGPHLGERVNEWIDNLAATGDRLLELPLFMVLIGLGVPAVVGGVIIARWGRKRPVLVRVLVGGEVALLLVFLALLADRRIARLQDQVRELRSASQAQALASRAGGPAASLPGVPATLPAARTAVASPTAPAGPAALDLAAARTTISKLFRDVRLEAQGAGEAVTFVQLQGGTPLVKAYVAIVDLQRPGVQVKINADLKTKRLTSAFAKEESCAVAINGEAGSSPALGAPLGTWSGHLVREGEVLLMEERDNPRPFLSFDRSGRATFVAAASRERAVPAGAYNVIWGRWDVLVDSQIQAGDFTRQPRTAMALDKTRTQLFLFVGDGRQPRNSVGFTRAEVANILRALGASDGMLCDEGGSSCMYLAATGGIVNTPADNGGRERPVYTHFGVVVK